MIKDAAPRKFAAAKRKTRFAGIFGHLLVAYAAGAHRTGAWQGGGIWMRARRLLTIVGAASVIAGAARAQTAAAVASPADTAWILAATALVLLMTLPGLALFYAGLVRSKNALSVMMHCISVACVASVLWLFGGYSLAFSGHARFLGDLAEFGRLGARASVVGTLPEPVFFGFQMAFAIITPALIIGAYVERIRFSAVLLFSGLWLLLVYAPVCHWVWGGGWLAQLHVMDFAGGIVVHATAGVSALVIVGFLGTRDGYPRDLSPPHNPGMTMIGAGLLWVGWYGFNGGSALAANGTAGMALIATHLSAASAGLTWALLERLRFKRASMVGAVTGVIAGLATVTPASGFISPAAGVLLGVCGSFVCFQAVELTKHRLRIDDSLDVFAVHGVGGILGALLVAILAHPLLGGVGYAPAMGPTQQIVVQLVAVLASCAWAAAGTALIALICRATVGLRARPEEIEEGLDVSHHGERAYPS